MLHPIILHKLSMVRTKEQALNVWREHFAELEGYTLVLSLPEGGNGIQIPARMDFASGGFLRSSFAHDQLWFLNHNILAENVVHERPAQIPLDYSIGFDANVASYLRSWMKGRPGPVVSALQTAFRDLNRGRFNWELMPYLYERSAAIIAGKDLTEIFETVLASEWFAASDRVEFMKSGQISLTVPEEEIRRMAQVSLADWHRLLLDGQLEWICQHYRMFHASVAKMTLLHLDSPGAKGASVKMESYLRFVDQELSCVSMLCLRGAFEFFSSGGGFAAMAKASNPASDLRQRVKNIAWDYFLIQWRQLFAGDKGRDNSFMIPYFMTFDKGLAALCDVFPQRSFLFGGDLDRPMFFQDFDISSLIVARHPDLTGLVKQTFTIERANQRERLLRNGPPDMVAIVQQLEAELEKWERG